MLKALVRLALAGMTAFAMMVAPAAAQALRGIVVDQTGLPLPGALVQLFDGPTLVRSSVCENDGTFLIDTGLPGDLITVSLEGFESARVPRAEAARIVLAIGRASETTTVVAPTAVATSPATALLGAALAAETVARLPSAHMKAKESLPLLPSVVRGPDGLLQLGGARAHETPVFLDGFNISDPATGLSSLNLPFEAVRGIDVLRDPMNVLFGGSVGGLVKMESRPGGEQRTQGVQGFVPRPRFANPGFGRIEGIFPRAHVSGSTASGAIRYFAAAEFDYERIPVPEVTSRDGPDIVEQSAIMFVRLDGRLSPRNNTTFEAFVFPTSTRASGLSPRRAAEATADLQGSDYFAGLTHRFAASDRTIFTVQIGVLTHRATLKPNGSGTANLSPSGWDGNWFASIDRTATRVGTLATWERVTLINGRSHDVSVSGELTYRGLQGGVTETPITVTDIDGAVVRRVEFGSSSVLAVHDQRAAIAARDVWQASERLQLDLGVRLDAGHYGGALPSGRIGARYNVDRSGVTVIKGGYGQFVGTVPLAVPAFDRYPVRIDRWFDPASGDVINEVAQRPSVGRLRLPRAQTATIGLERQFGLGLDAQVIVTERRSSRLPTLEVPQLSGDLRVESNGGSLYRELEISSRKTLGNDQQLFVSYVRSSARAELNDFTTMFRGFDAPLLQPGGMSRSGSDTRNRVLVWGTFNLPRRIVVSPVVEWRSGFPYSVVDVRHLYVGTPNSLSFPRFIASDMVIYKTVTVRKRTADLGLQWFNVTNHRNPRDVYSVIGAPRHGEFTNSVGPIVRGYMLLKW